MSDSMLVKATIAAALIQSSQVPLKEIIERADLWFRNSARATPFCFVLLRA